MNLALGDVYRDAWQVYRLLMRRSVATAAVVYALIALIEVAEGATGSFGLFLLLALASFVATIAGPVLVQGALVEIVRNIHEGRRPERIGTLFSEARDRFWSLLWASIVYGLGVIFGLLLFIVPGLLAAARWCLMAPLIMLEARPAGEARRRSSELVRGRTGPVLGIVVITFLLVYVPAAALGLAVGGWVASVVVTFVWSSITAPFQAHVLTVIYYRVTDPERPVIHPDVLRWSSVWAPSEPSG